MGSRTAFAIWLVLGTFALATLVAMLALSREPVEVAPADPVPRGFYAPLPPAVQPRR